MKIYDVMTDVISQQRNHESGLLYIKPHVINHEPKETAPTDRAELPEDLPHVSAKNREAKIHNKKKD